MPIMLGTKAKKIPFKKAYLGNVLKYEKITEEAFDSSIIPISWTQITEGIKYKSTNEYGEWIITANSYYNSLSSYPVNQAFDNNNDTSWSSEQLTSSSIKAEIIIECPVKIKPLQIYVNTENAGTSDEPGVFQGYNETNSSWETLCSANLSGVNVDINIDKFFSKFRVYSGRTASGTRYNRVIINELKIIKGYFKKGG